MKHKDDNRVVLLTGAGSGIGYALARKLAATSMKVVITAREHTLDKLRSDFTESDRLIIVPLDVTALDSHAAVLDTITSKFGAIHVLINNAGVSFRSTVEHLSRDEEQQQFAVNYFGPMNLIRLVLPTMRENRHGHIINVSSVGGMMAMPTMSAYSASKFALEGASESLWYEARPWGIYVTLIQPGFINSASFRRVVMPAAIRNIKPDDNPYHQHYTSMGRFIEKIMQNSFATSESVAGVIMKTIAKNKPPLRVQATLDAWFFTALRRFFPRRLYHPFLYRMLPDIDTWGK